MASCQNKVNIGTLTLGESKDETISNLNQNDMVVSEENDSVIVAYGTIYLLNENWDKVRCIFKDGKLDNIAMLRKLSTLSNQSAENIKRQMRELCGDGYTNFEEMTTVYGSDSNSGLCGGITAIWDNNKDDFFLQIGYVD